MITIYTIPSCPFCSKAISLLKKRNIKYKQISVKDKKEIKTRNKMTTFPQIFYKKHPIGGSDDLEFIIDICDDLKDNNISTNIIKGICKDLN
mgnify:CR=1 FL=1